MIHIFILFLFLLSTTSGWAQALKGDRITPFTLFYDPAKNGVLLEKQQIDYDLTTENALRVGPYFLSSDDVAMYLTKEQGEFFDIEFGIEVRRKLGPMYVASFKWPLDYLDSGHLEIQNDKGEVLWKRLVTSQDIVDWKKLIQDQKNKVKMTKEKLQEIISAQTGSRDKKSKTIPERINFNRPETLSALHSRSQFGFAYKGVFELPIGQIREPFRFCISKDEAGGRVGLCSRRYTFFREFGNYGVKAVSTQVRPRVLVNDRPVTLKGTALFLDYSTPVKFSALTQNGTYYEFISQPKEISVVELVHNKKTNKVEVLGYGDAPIGDVEKDFYSDNVMWSFLNFMPTIGDKRKYWRAFIPYENPALYLKGQGGVPFRQRFTFNNLPTLESRVELTATAQKATYNERPVLEGRIAAPLKVAASDNRVVRSAPEKFEWTFLAPQKGQMNSDEIRITENGKTYVADYQIYRGYPAELSARMTGVISQDLDLILLGEVAGQYWFEKILGMDSYRFSKLRWGLASKYFDTLLVESPSDSGFSSLSVLNVDLKYRLDPGIWARDPTVGLMLSAQQVDFEFKQGGSKTLAQTTMYGGGLFWARSMPRFFDDIFNIVPFMRYPKWVDMEAILYPLILDSDQKSVFSLAFNFHGKIQWTPKFFGEAGFGLKNFAWDDSSLGQIDPSTGRPTGKSIGFAVAYGTFGLGFNF